jgi:SAM-dependent methyltransferase
MEYEGERLRVIYEGYENRGAYLQKWNPSNPANRVGRLQLKADLKQTLLADLPEISTARILDAGCGTGQFLGLLAELGAQPANMLGVDLLEKHIVTATRIYPLMRFVVADLRTLPFASRTFDLVVCSTLFSSILDDAVAHGVASEIRRVLKPTGSILWYDIRYKNPTNSAVRPWTRQRISRLYPDGQTKLRTSRLLPPLARTLGPLTGVLYPLLHRIPLLRSNFLGVIHFRGGSREIGPVKS